MPPLTDPVILAQLRKVLAEWNCTGYVTAKEVARTWILDNLPSLSLKAIAKAMHEHLTSGGVIDQVKETRPEWTLWPFHYDFRLELAGKRVYIETVLKDDDPNDPTLEIVSIPMSEPSSSNGNARPFPWYCSKCRRKEVRRVTIPYQFSQKHSGQSVTITVPELAVPQCDHCGELTFDYEADEQLRKAFAEFLDQERFAAGGKKG